MPLRLELKETQGWDERSNQFVTLGANITLELEHSLVSLSKWESKHEIPFLADNDKTPDQLLDYLKTMIITPGVDPEVMNYCTDAQYAAIQEYINSKQTATTLFEPKTNGRPETITAELVYYWMVAFNIPWADAQHWHLNRLFTLIRVCNIKNTDPKKQKRSPNEIARERQQIMEQRRKHYNTRG